MNWQNLFIPKKLWHALKIEIKTVIDVIRYGLPTHLIQYFGGIGDDLLCSTVAREIKKRSPNAKIWISSNYPELFVNNCDIANVFLREAHWYLWYSPMLRSKRLQLAYTTKKYPGGNQKEDVSPIKHILKIMCEKAGITGDIKLRPYIYMAETEKNNGKIFDKQIAIQCMGEDTSMLNKTWYTERFQIVVNELKNKFRDYKIIQIGGHNDPELKGTTDMRGKTSIREAAAILSNSKLYIGTDSLLMHLARAVECRSVIIFGGRNHSHQTGYICNENLNTFISCAPCWKWNECDFNKKCMGMISIENVLEACCMVIEKSELPLETETVWIQ